MWRQQVGITEMMLAYIGEFAEFRGWSSWRSVVVDILSCHEQIRRERFENGQICNFGGISEDNEEWQREEVSKIVTESAHFPEDDGSTTLRVEGTEVAAPSIIKSEKSDSIHLHDESTISAEVKTEDAIEMEPDTIVLSDEEFKVASDDYDGRRNLLQLDNSLTGFHQNNTEFSGKSTGESSEGQLLESLPYKGRHVRDSVNTKSQSSHSIYQSFEPMSKQLYTQPRPSSDVMKHFTCNLCGKRFISYRNKVRHEAIHDGEKPFKCSMCPKTFNRKENMRFHERSHVGERPHVCEYCGKAFTRKDYKEKHEINIHKIQGPHSCRFCDRTFSRDSLKITHERSHISQIETYQFSTSIDRPAN